MRVIIAALTLATLAAAQGPTPRQVEALPKPEVAE